MVERSDLAAELKHLANEDLAVRQRLADTGELFHGYHLEMRAVHRRNGDRLVAILTEIGSWPGYRLVGEEGSEAGFPIAQHDIANPALIRRSRELYEVAVDNADADPYRLACLEDRIRYFEGRPQRYGTHVGWNGAGEFGPWPPVEEPERIDELRGELGLPPLADAIAAAERDHLSCRPVEEVLNEHNEADDFARQAGWRDDDRQRG